MVSAVSSSSGVSQLISASTGSSANTEAALEKQIAAKEGEAKAVKDQTEAAKVAAELATLKAKLAALQVADKEKEAASSKSSNAAAARQAEFDSDIIAPTSNSRYI